MASVTVSPASRTEQIAADSVVGGSFDGSNHLVLVTGDATNIDLGVVPVDFPDATTSDKGVVELATTSEVLAGTDGTKAITPLTLVAVTGNFTPATLTDASNIATDAAVSNHFRVTLGGNRTLSAPTNPRDGQMVKWEFIQDGTGGRTLALTTGTNGFAYGTDIPSITLSTAPNKRDFMGAIYNGTEQRWYILAFAKGY